MKYADILERLSGLGGDKWRIHFMARKRIEAGEDIIELTIGEPDIPTPPHSIETAYNAMRKGRTGYSNGQGEPDLLNAIARKASQQNGYAIHPNHILCLPGAQTAL